MAEIVQIENEEEITEAKKPAKQDKVEKPIVESEKESAPKADRSRVAFRKKAATVETINVTDVDDGYQIENCPCTKKRFVIHFFLTSFGINFFDRLLFIFNFCLNNHSHHQN